MNYIRDVVPIIYPAGAYGTYLEWVLTTLSHNNPIEEPFNTNTGNSHRFKGNLLPSMSGWHDFLSCPHQTNFVRLHPKITKQESLSQNLETILKSVNHLINIYPDHSTVLLSLNNYYTKVWTDWWDVHMNKEVSANYIYDNWPVSRDTPLNEVPDWIRREFLSFYLMPAWQDQVEWYFPDQWQNSQCCTVLISDLFYNFENTVYRVQQHCGLKFQRPVTDLLPSHARMLSLQKSADQDQLCAKIIDSILHDTEFEWKPLPMASQAWVQWKLRSLGWEIQCHGLDIFPNNSVYLQELLY